MELRAEGLEDLNSRCIDKEEQLSNEGLEGERKGIGRTGGKEFCRGCGTG